MIMQQKSRTFRHKVLCVLMLGACTSLPAVPFVSDGSRACGVAPSPAQAEWRQTPHRNCRGGRIDPEELRKQQEAYITREAGLTPGEAAFFFPSFRELKQKQRAIRKAIRAYGKRTREGKLSEKECDKALQKIQQLEKQNTDIEVKYYANWRKILPASKIIKILDADRRFSKQVFNRRIR